jgi:hypothetical protein
MRPARRHERQAHRDRVARVRRRFEEIRPEPAPRERDREQVALPREHRHAHDRHETLEQRAAERADHVAEGTEREVTELVDAEVQTAEEAAVGGVRGVTHPCPRQKHDERRAHPRIPPGAPAVDSFERTGGCHHAISPGVFQDRRPDGAA